MLASLCSDELYFVFSLLVPTCGCLVSYRGVCGGVCGLAMGPVRGCPLALARGMETRDWSARSAARVYRSSRF